MSARDSLNTRQRSVNKIRENMDRVREDSGLTGAEKKARLEHMQQMLNRIMREGVEATEEQGVEL